MRPIPGKSFNFRDRHVASSVSELNLNLLKVFLFLNTNALHRRLALTAVDNRKEAREERVKSSPRLNLTEKRTKSWSWIIAIASKIYHLSSSSSSYYTSSFYASFLILTTHPHHLYKSSSFSLHNHTSSSLFSKQLFFIRIIQPHPHYT